MLLWHWSWIFFLTIFSCLSEELLTDLQLTLQYFSHIIHRKVGKNFWETAVLLISSIDTVFLCPTVLFLHSFLYLILNLKISVCKCGEKSPFVCVYTLQENILLLYLLLILLYYYYWEVFSDSGRQKCASMSL
jgi:hypothetical protein